MKIENAVVMITGGASGIGEACAKSLSEMGARISVCDIEENLVNRVVADIAQSGGNAIGITGNVTSEKDQSEFVRKTVEAFGRLNVLIPSAGIIRDGLMIKTDRKTGRVKGRMSLEQWRSVIDVNLTGTFLSIREASAVIAENGWEGILFTISSIGKEGQVGQLNYSASKMAVAQMPKILAGEFMMRGIQNIRVVGIAPGFVNTGILQNMNQDALTSMLKDVCLGRLIEPAEIVDLIVHCVQNEAINATTIEITGGLCYSRSRAK